MVLRNGRIVSFAISVLIKPGMSYLTIAPIRCFNSRTIDSNIPSLHRRNYDSCNKRPIVTCFFYNCLLRNIKWRKALTYMGTYKVKYQKLNVEFTETFTFSVFVENNIEAIFTTGQFFFLFLCCSAMKYLQHDESIRSFLIFNKSYSYSNLNSRKQYIHITLGLLWV